MGLGRLHCFRSRCTSPRGPARRICYGSCSSSRPPGGYGLVETTSLCGAVARGDIDIVQLASRFSSTYLSGKGDTAWGSPEVVFLRRLGGGTIARGSFEYLRSLFKPEAVGVESYQIQENARAGNTAMVRPASDRCGTAAQGFTSPAASSLSRTPSGRAATRWSTCCSSTGADLKCADQQGTLLTVAAEAGSMAMLRKLLDAGAGSPCSRFEALRTTEEMGLESMADLLRAKGVRRPFPLCKGF